MTRVFVDTSVFVAALLSRTGASFYILRNTRELNVTFVTSGYVLMELRRTVMQKFPEHEERLMALLAGADIAIVPTPPTAALLAARRVIADPEDAPILAAFLRSRVPTLISLDSDFLKLSLAGQNIVTPGDFLAQRRA